MRILRLRDVIQKTGLGRSSLYKFSALGKFPAAAKLGGMSVGWTAGKINQWIAQRIRERDSSPSNSNHITAWTVVITKDDTSEIDLRVLRIRHVMTMTGLARSTVYKYIAEKDFPRPIPLAGTSVGWIEAEVKHWLADSFESTSVEQACRSPEPLSQAA